MKKVNLNKTIFIEGLPGIGLVGKLVASPSFPPQVLVDENGIIEPMKNEFYYLKSAGTDHRDLIILTGNT